MTQSLDDPDEESVNADTLRRVMGEFATGVTVVTMATEEGPHGITVNAFTSVSADPPLVLVCLDHDSRAYELVSTGAAERFRVNVLASDQRDIAEHFAGMAEHSEPFADATAEGESDAPVFKDSLAHLDCTLEGAHPGGDHTIYVGRVRAAETLRPTAPPLTFFRGEWGTNATAEADGTAERATD